MHTTTIDAMSPELIEQWEALHAAGSPGLGPMLHPGYVRAASAARPDVEVGLVSHNGEVCGFLPFQRTAWHVARPVGDRLCDQAGAVVRPGTPWSPETFARDAGLRAIRMPRAITSDDGLRPFLGTPIESSHIDLSDGFDAYRAAKLESGSNIMKQMDRRTRKATKELGPPRFEWHTDDDSVFETLLAWKAAQRKATRSPNVLDLPWARDLVERLRAPGDERFGGVLSALWFGDTLAAAHFGIRTRDVLHYWITAYGLEAAPHSPGLICLVRVAQHGAEHEGIRRIDLGVGDQRFKDRVSTGTAELATATVTAGPGLATAYRVADKMRTRSRGSTAGEFARVARRAVQRGSYLARSVMG